MELKLLTLITPKIQVSEIFPALELIMSHQAIDEAISETNSQEKRIGERVRAIKLLRSVESGMLLTWDRGLHFFKMVEAALSQQCHILGRIPKNVKFPSIQELADGSYLSWINPDRTLASRFNGS